MTGLWRLKNDLEELEINLSFEDIRRKSRHAFKTLVSKATTKRALTFLLEEKNKLSKVSHIPIWCTEFTSIYAQFDKLENA